MGGNTGPVIQNTTVYKLGWGQLNDNGNVNWKVHFTNLQLDIVGFLAILGEGSLLATSSVATLSRVVYLPRLLPAPQALLRPSRPDKLLSEKGWATAVRSGNDRDYVNYIGHTLADAESLPEFSVKCVRIARKHNDGQVKAKMFGPTTAVAIFGFLLSLGLFALCIVQQDGMGMLADICLSSLSSLIGFGNKWTLTLPVRKHKNLIDPPEGDVVIRYPKGNFLLVRCTEDVARELYFAPETVEYLIAHPWKYRMIALVGTTLLMFGVIFLGNAGTYVQVGYAGAYMMLNVVYWVVAALPQRYHWDMNCFTVTPESFDEPPNMKRDHYEQDDKEEEDLEVQKMPKVTKSLPLKRKPWISYNDTYTQALWKVIVATREIEWIKRNKAAPVTDAWNDWLCEAFELARDMPSPENQVQEDGTNIPFYKVPAWDPQAALNQCIRDHKAHEMEKAEKKTAKKAAERANDHPVTTSKCPTCSSSIEV
jgi:hypothetical protein